MSYRSHVRPNLVGRRGDSRGVLGAARPPNGYRKCLFTKFLKVIFHFAVRTELMTGQGQHLVIWGGNNYLSCLVGGQSVKQWTSLV